MQRHAEIAGGGIAGLGLGMMLARHGWTVRVHERSPEIREVGAGIYIKNNSIRVLEHYGVYSKFEPHGTTLKFARIRDATGRIMQQRPLTGHHRVLVLPRQSLVDILAEAAREAGVEIATGSHIVAAEPSGVLVNEAGRKFRCDLAVAADGFRSKARDSLGVGARSRELETTINRYLVPTRSFTREDVTTEHWSGHRRIGITPSGAGHSYAYVVMPRRDAGACALPLDVANWGRSHPALRTELEIFSRSEVTQYPYILVDCPKWSVGRAAVIGDAAHGLPPTLGQGAGLTLMNSHALAEIVSDAADVQKGLEEWERAVRFISDATQRWAVRYDRFTRQWPQSLRMLRPGIVWAFGRFRFLNERMRIADRGLDLTSVRLAR
jgi:2-polyprenyl-6-methoxyphenol hydroxylase-like FAD-dependent oxidoreductase